MNDIINELRQPVATSFEPDCVEQGVAEMYKRGLKAADIIEQQQKRIAELEAEIESKRNSILDILSDVLDAKDEMLRLGIEQDSFPNMFSKILEILAAPQAREAVLREAFHAYIDEHEECTDADGWMAMICPMDAHHVADEALSQPSDDSALKAALAAERERCAKVCESIDSMASSNPPMLCAAAIRNMKGEK